MNGRNDLLPKKQFAAERRISVSTLNNWRTMGVFSTEPIGRGREAGINEQQQRRIGRFIQLQSLLCVNACGRRIATVTTIVGLLDDHEERRDIRPQVSDLLRDLPEIAGRTPQQLLDEVEAIFGGT